LGRARFAADGIAVYGRVAPAKDLEAFVGGNALEDAFALQAAVFVHRKKSHGDAISAGAGKLDSKFAAFAREEDMRDLNEDAGTITGFGITPGRSAMREVDKNLNTLPDDVVAFFATNAGDKTHTARIMLISRMIEALWTREAAKMIRCLHWYLP
jgi:hypothetical protein